MSFWILFYFKCLQPVHSQAYPSSQLFYTTASVNTTGISIDLTPDNSINYIIGNFLGSSLPDVFVRAVSTTTRNQLWNNALSTATTDLASDIAASPDNNFVYVTGSTGGALNSATFNGGDSDGFLVKYNSAGSLQWTVLVGTSAIDEIKTVVVSSDQNVYVAGSTTGSFGSQTNQGGRDVFVSKIDGTGSIQWTKFLGSSGDEEAFGIAVSSDGNSIYVVGRTTGNFSSNTNFGFNDGFVAKLSNSGSLTWVKLIGSSSQDNATDVSISPDGNSVYVVGYTLGLLTGQSSVHGVDSYLAKFDTDGNMSWFNIIPGTNDEYAMNVKATADSKAIYITGSALNSRINGQEMSSGSISTFLV